MNEFFSSIGEHLNKRVTTALLGTYTAFWLVLHWQAVYTTIFVSEQRIFDKFGMLKNEYVHEYFLSPRYDDPTYYLGFLVPALLTWLYIWILPQHLFTLAYSKEQSYKFNKRKIRVQQEIDFENTRARLAKATTKTLVEEVKASKVEKQIESIDPEKALGREFDNFMNISGSSTVLGDIADSVYKHFGHTTAYSHPANGSWIQHSMKSSSLAQAHSHGLIDYNGKDGMITLTDKGKYFISHLSPNYL